MVMEDNHQQLLASVKPSTITHTFRF